MAPIGNESALASIALPWVFEKLVTVDATGQLTPQLAGRVERLSSGQIRLELRLGATFSDGSPVSDGDIATHDERKEREQRKENHLKRSFAAFDLCVGCGARYCFNESLLLVP